MRIRFLTFLFLFYAVTATAQYKQGNQEVSVGAGAATSEQIFDGNSVGIFGPSLKQYTDNSVSGIWFADYKYFISKRVTIGIFGGIENESGDWNYFEDNGGAYDWETFKKGTFVRSAYTIAPEVSVAYVNQKDVRIYSTLGVGATFKNEVDTYDTGYYNKGYYNGNNMYGNSRSLLNDVWKFNAYFSPFGMSFGTRLRGYFEFGFGYKGVLNGGIAYKISTVTRGLRGVHGPSLAPVILLPADYPVGNGMRYMEGVQSGRMGGRKEAEFGEQLEKAAAIVQEDGGNVFRIAEVKGIETKDRFNIKGEGYYVANYDSFKTSVATEKNKPFEKEQCAFLVIYCPNIGKMNNYRLHTAVRINDSSTVNMPRNFRYIVKLTKEGKNIITTDKSTITVNAKFGHYYYVRVHVLHKKSWGNIVDNMQGELESSVIRDRGSDEKE